MLCVTDWGNRTLSFHLPNGKQIRSEKPLGFNACRIVPYRHAGGDYLLVCGSNRQCQLFSNEGYALGSIAGCSKWVWATTTKQNSTVVAVGSKDGTVGCHQLIFSTVHGLYKERYAFREHLTDVVVHHLLTEEKVRICCRDLIKKIAIYKSRLAVQLQEKLMIYEQQEGEQLHYVIKEKISQNFECSLMVICTNHIILCHGVKERKWTLDSPVRYIKIVGEPANKEGLLLGLKNGQVSKIFLDNPFPVELLKISVRIRCLDLSSSRQKVAIVDDNNTCSVYQLSNSELISQEPHANSVAWNIHCEDMVCFSGQNWLNIKASNFPCHQQKFQGYVVGSTAPKSFACRDIAWPPFSLRSGLYGRDGGRLVQLAHESVNALELDIATQAFQRIQDYKYLELMELFANRKRLGGPQANINHNVFIGDILAWQGKFNEEARLYRKCGRSDKAVALFTDLRLFDQAQKYLGGDSTTERMNILKKRADWAQDIHDPRAAAEMYLNAGEILKAVEIIAANGWTSMLVDASRRLDATDQASTLRIIADHLRRLGSVQLACDILRRLALALAKQHPDISRNVYLPYARWLAKQEQFIEAQQAYYGVGCLDEAERVLNTLAMNSVALNKYEDASHFFWLFAKHRLQLATKALAIPFLQKLSE
ncbi:intraflagellar transport protein 122 homolog [Daphnia pulex]|uniref:intraflagellar transport protein 122 homolog n=1 Tax=Daphnia pulex TaxID=6669 RepID=UPI001EE034F6|nr:intraflagellar transport protein 122 homolog [Daphnia pulex]